MIRCGIDASTKSTGWCIFNDDKLIAYGKIVPDKDDLNWRERVVFMMNKIVNIIKEYNVEELCVENPVKTIKNVNTLEQLFSLHGAMLGVASALHVNFIPIDVNQWRKRVGILKDIPFDTKDKRSILKERSVLLVNELYELNLVWKSNNSKFNDDDISDSILIAHAIIHK